MSRSGQERTGSGQARGGRAEGMSACMPGLSGVSGPPEPDAKRRCAPRGARKAQTGAASSQCRSSGQRRCGPRGARGLACRMMRLSRVAVRGHSGGHPKGDLTPQADRPTGRKRGATRVRTRLGGLTPEAAEAAEAERNRDLTPVEQGRAERRVGEYLQKETKKSALMRLRTSVSRGRGLGAGDRSGAWSKGMRRPARCRR
jgi:hypothetical protein